MTREDTKKILAAIKAAYPNHFKDEGIEKTREILELWSAMFADDSAEAVAGAVKAYICADSSGFPPVIGQIKNKMRELCASEELPETVAWAMVRKAIANSGYNSVAEFEKLPPDVRACVTPELLREWALDEKMTEQVAASNFMRAYRTKAAERKQLEALPADVRQMFLDSRAVKWLS